MDTSASSPAFWSRTVRTESSVSCCVALISGRDTLRQEEGSNTAQQPPWWPAAGMFQGLGVNTHPKTGAHRQLLWTCSQEVLMVQTNNFHILRNLVPPFIRTVSPGQL